jgi:hypothetical protein
MDQNAHEHEEIHLPPPSIAPLIVATGITLTAVGLLVPPLLIVGALVLVIGLAMWVFSRG